MAPGCAAHQADAGARFQIGRYDDLLEEEREAVQIALKRLSPKEAYERVYRIRRSTQCSYQHKLLPRDQWTKPEEVPTSSPEPPSSPYAS